MTNCDKPIGVIGLPFDKGQPRKGVNYGPEFLRNGGAVKVIKDLGYDVTDHGDVQLEDITDDPPSYGVKLPRTIGADMKRLSDKVFEVVSSGSISLQLGGDHTLGIGSIYGHMRAKPNTAVIWVDAHADINPPPASPSGNIHGMPLAFLIKEVQDYMPKLPGFEWIEPCLLAQDVAFIGLRDVDLAEKKLIKDLGITYYDMYDVESLGIQQVVDGALNAVSPRNNRPIHLSFDIDALDPVHCPSTGTPVPGGLTLREGMYVTERIFRSGNLSAFDLVEVNPKLGSAEDVETTVKSGIELISAAFGKRTVDFIPDSYQIPRPE